MHLHPCGCVCAHVCLLCVCTAGGEKLEVADGPGRHPLCGSGPSHGSDGCASDPEGGEGGAGEVGGELVRSGEDMVRLGESW